MEPQEFQQLVEDLDDVALKPMKNEVLLLTQRVISIENRIGQVKPGEVPDNLASRLDEYGKDIGGLRSQIYDLGRRMNKVEPILTELDSRILKLAKKVEEMSVPKKTIWEIIAERIFKQKTPHK